ncbi:hypothetical protein ACQPX6_00380 [Actinomycetospora sp. CA-101289]|uniref:hypothetical protein n=1 Tax=Actinomycetospora sp. CA-101289 TaxID=3239893 RepID=UPI003D95483A
MSLGLRIGLRVGLILAAHYLFAMWGGDPSIDLSVFAMPILFIPVPVRLRRGR